MNKKELKAVPDNVKWQDITKGGTVSCPGNAQLVRTGDWRSMRPVFIEEKCKQCLLCYPVCPDVAIPVNDEGKREDFDFDHCKGCGICAKVCPFDAIDFVEESK